MYPLWLCPTRHLIPEGLEHLAFFRREDLHIDVGVYGCDLPFLQSFSCNFSYYVLTIVFSLQRNSFSELKGFDRVESQRRLERYVIDLDGYNYVSDAIF